MFWFVLCFMCVNLFGVLDYGLFFFSFKKIEGFFNVNNLYCTLLFRLCFLYILSNLAKIVKLMFSISLCAIVLRLTCVCVCLCEISALIKHLQAPLMMNVLRSRCCLSTRLRKVIQTTFTTLPCFSITSAAFCRDQSPATEQHRRLELPKELTKNVIQLSCDSMEKGGVCDVYLVGTFHGNKVRNKSV